MNRRCLLTAVPAVGFVGLIGASAVPAVAATETPVMAMFREWQPIAAWLNGPEGQAASTEDFDHVNDQRIDLEDRMMNEPARSAADVLAKMTARTHFGEDEMGSAAHLPQVWAEAREMIAA